MAKITLNNTALIPYLLGVGDFGEEPEATTVAQDFSELLVGFGDIYADFVTKLNESLANDSSAVLERFSDNWVVTGIWAGTNNGAFSIELSNGVGMFGLTGRVTPIAGTASFSFAATSLEFEPTTDDNLYFFSVPDPKTSPVFTLTQLDPNLVWRTNNFYPTGNTSLTTVGALLEGAVLTAATSMPTSFQSIGTELYDGAVEIIGVQGTINVSTSGATSGAVSGSLTSSFRNADKKANGEPYSEIYQFGITNGGFNSARDDVAPDFGIFGTNAGLSLTRIDFSTESARLDPSIWQATFPPGSFSTVSFTGATGSLALPNGTVLSQVLAGNDEFVFNTTTDSGVIGGRGNDTISAGSGNDWLIGGPGDDRLNGGAGNDYFLANYAGWEEYSYGDSLGNFYAYSGNSVLSTTSPATNVSVTRLGIDSINGGSGLDTVVFAEGVPTDLKLLIPSQYYWALNQSFNGSFVDSEGRVGFRYKLDEAKDFYYAFGATSPGSIGFFFTQSFTVPETNVSPYEAINLVDVEFLRIESGEKAGIYDIRPLYLASPLADTLYAFDRPSFEAIEDLLSKPQPLGYTQQGYVVTVSLNEFKDAQVGDTASITFLTGSSPSRIYKLSAVDPEAKTAQFISPVSATVTDGTLLIGRGTFNDSLSIYRENFREVQVGVNKDDEGDGLAIKEWRYYMNGGGGNDILYGSDRAPDLADSQLPRFDENGNPYWLRDGSSGRDVLAGGAGNDTLIGRTGNDIYHIEDAGDVIIELPHEGFDSAFVATSYVLPANVSVERLGVIQVLPSDTNSFEDDGIDLGLFFSGRAQGPVPVTTAINITGSNYTFELFGHDGPNVIRAGNLAGMLDQDHDPEPLSGRGGALLLGLGGNDTLFGGSGNDHLIGGWGNDTLFGEAGNDRFYTGFEFASLEARQLLPIDFIENRDLGYPTLRFLGYYDDFSKISGGNDVASGGDGFDIVVIGAPPAYTIDQANFAQIIGYQRISETQIEISTVLSSIRVDATTEAVEFLRVYDFGNSPPTYSVQTALLPWMHSLDERERDKFYNDLSSNNFEEIYSAGTQFSPFVYVPPSNFSDLIILDAFPESRFNPEFQTFDAGAGNDIVYAPTLDWGYADENSDEDYSYLPSFTRIDGGAGDDWIYSGAFPGSAEDPSHRYELIGGLGNGNDTLTLDTGYLSEPNVKVILDGGAGNDHYRIALRNQADAGKYLYTINDSAGTDRLTVAQSSEDFDIKPFWDASGFKLVQVQEDGAGKYEAAQIEAGFNVLEQFFYTADTRYFDWGLGGNLVNPNAAAINNGVLTGGALNDVLLPILGQKLNYSGGAGDDLIIIGSVSGSIASGGPGKNTIYVMYDWRGESETDPRSLSQVLSYTWTPAGSNAEIDLQAGYAVVATAGGLLAVDNFNVDRSAFTDVLGGAANERIQGNDRFNRLDGGAGNDVLYSGKNLVSSTLTGRDHLIGGAGDDILVEETHWGSYDFAEPDWTSNNPNWGRLQGSLLEGGAGNDTYVISHNGALGWSGVVPTQIVERTPAGLDTGGIDTIRFFSSESSKNKGPLAYTQTGNIVTVFLHETPDAKVGEKVLITFLTGSSPSNIYTLSAVNPEAKTAQFISPVSATVTAGTLLGQGVGTGFGSPVQWLDANNYVLFSAGETREEEFATVAANPLAFYTGPNGQLNSPMAIQAVIDRAAADFIELSYNSPEAPGHRMKVSFDTGTVAYSEVISSGSNGPAMLYGGAGSDFIIDTPWSDILIGGDGNDVITSFFGQDVLSGGAGDDILAFRSDGQILIGGSGADFFVFEGTNKSGSHNNGSALITDYLPWEGDELVISHEFLGRMFEQAGGRDLAYLNEEDLANAYFGEVYYNEVGNEFVFYINLLLDINDSQKGYSATEMFRLAQPLDADKTWKILDTAYDSLNAQVASFPADYFS